MFKRLQLVVLLVSAALLASVSRPASRAVDTGSEPQAILAKAWSQIDIRAPGSRPFILKATVRLIDGDKSTGGVYAMSWAAPDRFRRVMGFRDYVQPTLRAARIIIRNETPTACLSCFGGWRTDGFICRSRKDIVGG